MVLFYNEQLKLQEKVCFERTKSHFDLWCHITFAYS